MRRMNRTAGASGVLAAAALLLAMAAAAQDAGPPKEAFTVRGLFVEGCSCPAPCPCQLVGFRHGCQGVGALRLTAGRFRGVSLAGVEIAYATLPSVWTRLYVDAPTVPQREAAMELARRVYAPFGEIEAVTPARIEIAGVRGSYRLTVDNGRVMTLETEAVIGGDGKTAVGHTNVKDALNSTLYQAKTIRGSFADGERKFELQGSNSFFNDQMNKRGEL